MDYATITKVKDGFDAVEERIKTVEKETDQGMVEMKQVIDDLQKQLKAYRAAMAGRSDVIADQTRFWPSDEEAKKFGELVLAAASQKAMGEVAGTGGMLVPTELSSWIIQKLGIYGKFRRDALVVKMGSSTMLVPKVSSDLTIFCPGEGGVIDESDMEFGQVSLTARQLCCLAKVSRELEEDSVVAIGEIIGLSMARSLARKEDLIGFLGDGTSTYFGMTGIVGALRAVDETIGNIKSLVVGSGNTYAELTLGDFRKVIGILPTEADDEAKWYMSKKFYYNVVYPLAETAGVANIFEILSDKKGRYLLGYPVEFVSDMPSVEDDSQICALLGDLKLGAFLGERREMRVERSDHVHFSTNQIGFRGTERITTGIYGVGDTTESGPICGLITAAS